LPVGCGWSSSARPGYDVIACTAGYVVFFCNNPPTTEIYTLSLHDALPILRIDKDNTTIIDGAGKKVDIEARCTQLRAQIEETDRSEEHTSELQSPCNLVCRLLLEKKNPRPSRLTHIPPSRATSKPANASNS